MYDGYRDDVLRRLLTPRWLGALLLAALSRSPATTSAGGSTTATRRRPQRNERLDAHYRAAPVPLPDVLTPAAPAPSTTSGPASPSPGGTPAGRSSCAAAPTRARRGSRCCGRCGRMPGAPTSSSTAAWPPRTAPSVLPEVAPALRPRHGDGMGAARGGAARSSAAAGPGRERRRRGGRAELGSAAVLPGYVLLQSEAVADGSTPPRPEPLAAPDRAPGPTSRTRTSGGSRWRSASCRWFGIRREVRAEDQVPAEAEEDTDLGRGGRVVHHSGPGRRAPPRLVHGLSTISWPSSQAEMMLASSPGWLKRVVAR